MIVSVRLRCGRRSRRGLRLPILTVVKDFDIFNDGEPCPCGFQNPVIVVDCTDATLSHAVGQAPLQCRFAPATLLAALEREAARARGTLTRINPRTTALSQHCVCGARIKKPLAQRWHTCACAYLGDQPVHRDLMSAFLHTTVITTTSPAQSGDRFDPLLATALWGGRPGAGECLRAAGTNPNHVHLVDEDSTWTNPDMAVVARQGRRSISRAGRRHAHAPADPCDDVATPSGEGAGKTGPAKSKNPPRTTAPGFPPPETQQSPPVDGEVIPSLTRPASVRHHGGPDRPGNSSSPPRPTRS
jgi:hypothetical protein